MTAADHPILVARELHKDFSTGRRLRWNGAWPTLSRRVCHAVDNVDIGLQRGTTLALVGESGCGKSTLARLIAGLIKPTRGEICFEGRDVSTLSRAEVFALRRRIQMVFQNPLGSLNPRWTIEHLIAEPLVVHRFGDRRAIRRRVEEAMESVGLGSALGQRHPHQLSGGQLQRAAIARAITLDPDIIVLDEPVSALDVSIQAQILNLLVDMQAARPRAYLFVSHDLGVVRYVAQMVAVMYLGRLLETGPVDAVFRRPRHPYTALLLDSVPSLAKRTMGPAVARGEPTTVGPATCGCTFEPRCPASTSLCRNEAPPLREETSGRAFACHHPVTGSRD